MLSQAELNAGKLSLHNKYLMSSLENHIHQDKSVFNLKQEQNNLRLETNASVDSHLLYRMGSQCSLQDHGT